MLYIYAKPSSHVLAIQERVAVNIQGTVFVYLSKIKNIPTIKMSHPMPEQC